jgi:hypothetical protein
MSLRFNLFLTRLLLSTMFSVRCLTAFTGSTILIVQPFYAWAAPRLRDVAINGLFWGLIALIDIARWLANTTRQFMARDAQAITFSAFAQAHEPLPEFPALAPAAIPLEPPSRVKG